MYVKLLGTAAGGAFPQWNCACRNCRRLREGGFQGKARTQLQVAISADNESWFLLNVSPDVRSQIETNSVFQPRGTPRGTPITGVVLTGADLDQVLGLLMLREFQQFQIYATEAVQRILREDNSMFAVLNRIPDQVTWQNITPGHLFHLSSGREKTGLSCTPVSLGEHFPAYISDDRRRHIPSGETLLGLIIQGESGQRLGYFPAVPEISRALLEELAEVDVVLFDGTFWVEDELTRIGGTRAGAGATGHIPVSGSGGSLQLLSGIKARKIYVHINNTNPMLDESGAEYQQVRATGWEIGEDGWEFRL